MDSGLHFSRLKSIPIEPFLVTLDWGRGLIQICFPPTVLPSHIDWEWRQYSKGNYQNEGGTDKNVYQNLFCYVMELINYALPLYWKILRWRIRELSPPIFICIFLLCAYSKNLKCLLRWMLPGRQAFIAVILWNMKMVLFQIEKTFIKTWKLLGIWTIKTSFPIIYYSDVLNHKHMDQVCFKYQGE